MTPLDPMLPVEPGREPMLSRNDDLYNLLELCRQASPSLFRRPYWREYARETCRLSKADIPYWLRDEAIEADTLGKENRNSG